MALMADGNQGPRPTKKSIRFFDIPSPHLSTCNTVEIVYFDSSKNDSQQTELLVQRSQKEIKSVIMNTIFVLFTLLCSYSNAFAPSVGSSTRGSVKLFMGDEEPKAAPLVSGSDLELMLTEWDEPLVIDAYATW